ncbi:hypothetical protein BCR33DRAFT_857138 [Rhizoclosmatium globosum]|uniref:Uncharacterized protein n=1 Tax=Rhizoclosmatium globosum TaxID=329046 RepID=A0A1Y2BAS8_9FUNG|nr:hypothetical protein BCR33DRAFT_857138 [Rhizoclosmatium globosum]|eukprot:ORY31185.1 hypothetical protein BCR33DRAFT_857138 [Rhizoclosmatium globosum]
MESTADSANTPLLLDDLPQQPRPTAPLGEALIVSVLSLVCPCALPTALAAVWFSSKVDPHATDVESLTVSRTNASTARILVAVSSVLLVLLWIAFGLVLLQMLRP